MYLEGTGTMVLDHESRIAYTACSHRAEHGRAVIDLSPAQVRAFAGNAIELRTPTGRILALSTTALASLDPDQLEVIGRNCRSVPLPVPTIELAGGSVRCMIAGIHLDPRPGTAGRADPAHSTTAAAAP